ncbi:chemotaxis protein CheC [Clostridium sp.]|uniref:chemotaxis protein CheC n=1 Tax=Clostridium sp. TaxID=1506 RepID=UPI003217985A
MEFNELQIDAIREIANIGLGNAATAMAQILGREIQISVPKVNVISLEDIFEKVEDETIVYAVIARVLGEAPGNILFMFHTSTMMKIAELLLGHQDGDELDEMGYSALGEIGNIIFATYMNAIGQMTGLNLFPSVPAVARDMFSAVLSTSFIESGQFNDSVLDIETGFTQENEDLRGDFYFIPMPGSLEKILESLGLN